MKGFEVGDRVMWADIYKWDPPMVFEGFELLGTKYYSPCSGIVREALADNYVRVYWGKHNDKDYDTVVHQSLLSPLPYEVLTYEQCLERGLLR